VTDLKAGSEHDFTEPVAATVQLLTTAKATHQHRADLAKLIVLPAYQGRGLARQ
jgi:ribosomal protein S18 acetylase RimI-like enzyme